MGPARRFLKHVFALLVVLVLACHVLSFHVPNMPCFASHRLVVLVFHVAIARALRQSTFTWLCGPLAASAKGGLSLPNLRSFHPRSTARLENPHPSTSTFLPSSSDRRWHVSKSFGAPRPTRGRHCRLHRRTNHARPRLAHPHHEQTHPTRSTRHTLRTEGLLREKRGGGGWMTPCSHTFHTLVSSLTSPISDAKASMVVKSWEEQGDHQHKRVLVDARARPLGRSTGETPSKTTRDWLGRWSIRVWGCFGHPRHV